jgi:hypothetical protein
VNTFGKGVSFIRAPFISSTALFWVMAALTEISIRFGRPGGLAGLIGFSLLAFSMLMLTRLKQVLRFFIPSTNEDAAVGDPDDGTTTFRRLQKQSMAPTNAGQTKSHAKCSEGLTDGQHLNVGA